MKPRKLSVVVVSTGRPSSLALCLTALSQQTYRPLEIVVVACPEGLAAAERHSVALCIKCVAQDVPNVARARNLGIEAAGGEIIAFIDDDAFAEPTWAESILRPFDETEVAAVGGFVRGRNGISLQWGAQRLDRNGVTHPAVQSPVRTDPNDRAIKLEGCNFAVRAEVVKSVGGFDESFAFLFDDTDFAMRLQRAGYRAAMAPSAQVVHLQAPSPNRAPDRMPRDLFHHGFGIAGFASRHSDNPQMAIAQYRDEQQRRLLRAMVSGSCAPEDIGRLLRRFDRGTSEGRKCSVALRDGWASPQAFEHIECPAHAETVLAGWASQSARLRKAAAQRTLAGERVSLFVFSPTTLFHKVRYREPGYWEQTGGLWGKSERTEPVVQVQSFASRLQKEIDRVALLRGIPQDWRRATQNNTWLTSAAYDSP